jgi:zinc/manganese transport system permease protein
MFDLMLVPIVAGLVILSIHAYLGLHVIARGVIFVDLAFAQIAALGATVGLLMGVEHHTATALGFSLGFTLLGALIFSFSRLRNTVVPQEAIIGITYVVASAAVLLLAGFTSEGAEHVSETLTGTLIWVTWPQVIRVALVYVILGGVYVFFRKQFARVSFNPDRVPRARLWDFFFYVTFGVAITFSVPIAGVLLVFSFLVIPAVVAFLFTNQLTTALLLAWLAGALALVAGVAASFVWDLATGPLLVCAFGLMLLLALVARHLMGVKTETFVDF